MIGRMSSKASSAKLSLFLLSIFSFTLFFLIIGFNFLKKSQFTVFTKDIHVVINGKNHHSLTRGLNIQHSSGAYAFIAEEFKGNQIRIGLVNMVDGREEWDELGETSLILFDRAPESLDWNDIFPTWIDEENWELTECPNIPMPKFNEYSKFNVIVARVPCGVGDETKGIRDVFRLQVNLVVANLAVRNGHNNQVYVVFIGSCGPMWEIFRCDDLVKHKENIWIYKPDMRRLKQKVSLPVGSCQMSVPYVKQGNGDIHYDFSRLDSPIDHPREAYVTVLHSSEAYVCGAIVLAQSIMKTNTNKDLVLLADSSLSNKSRQALEMAGWKIKHIERIESPFATKDAYNKWNYSKLRIWQLTEYDKVIFIDSDLIVLRNIDNFFKHPQLSAARNNRFIFNSGVMVIEPSNCVFETLMKKRHTLFSYNGGDQGFLNEAFTWWHRLPGRLNYYKYFDEKTTFSNKVPKSLYAVHYLGMKPWMCYRDYDCNWDWDSAGHHQYASDLFHKIWWQIHDSMPKKLHGFCNISESMHLKLREMRKEAESSSFPNGHWKINVKDPRQHKSSEEHSILSSS